MNTDSNFDDLFIIFTVTPANTAMYICMYVYVSMYIISVRIYIRK